MIFTNLNVLLRFAHSDQLEKVLEMQQMAYAQCSDHTIQEEGTKGTCKGIISLTRSHNYFILPFSNNEWILNTHLSWLWRTLYPLPDR